MRDQEPAAFFVKDGFLVVSGAVLVRLGTNCILASRRAVLNQAAIWPGVVGGDAGREKESSQ